MSEPREARDLWTHWRDIRADLPWPVGQRFDWMLRVSYGVFALALIFDGLLTVIGGHPRRYALPFGLALLFVGCLVIKAIVKATISVQMIVKPDISVNVTSERTPSRFDRVFEPPSEVRTDGNAKAPSAPDLSARLLRADGHAEALAPLIARWRAEAARIDTFHATMGTGYHVCADELEALVAPLPTPPAPARPEATP